MTVQEAKKIMEMFLHKQCDLQRTEFAYSQNEVWDAVKMSADALEEVEQYRALGTVEELKEAREKQVASKPLYRQGTLFKWIDTVRERGRNVNVPKWSNRDACPNCKKDVLKTNYCPNCGQALDWSEEDD